jgi:hypothetical protein
LKIETKYRRVRERIRGFKCNNLARALKVYTVAAKYQADDLRRHPPAAR